MTIPIKIISKKEYLKENLEPNQEEVWDNLSIPWDKYVVKTIPIVEKFLLKISSEWKDSEKLKIIDLGCGSGRNMIKFNGIKYYAVDFSSKQIENAKKL